MNQQKTAMNTDSGQPITALSFWVMAAIVVFALVLRIAAAFVLNAPPISDELGYLSMAKTLLAGEHIVDNFGNYAFFNIGYPLLIVAPVFAVFGENLMAIYAVNAVLGAITTCLVCLLAKEAGAKKVGQALAGLIWAIYLPSLLNTGAVAKEHLMVPLMVGILWCSLRTLNRPSLWVLALGGVLFGITSLVGNAGLSIALAAVFALVLAPTNLAFKLKGSVIVVVLFAAIATPWIIRNNQVLGHPTLNTNGGFNLYLGNNDAATGNFVSIADTAIAPEWEELRTNGEYFTAETLKQLAKDWIAENPRRFAELTALKGALFWSPGSVEATGSAEAAMKWLRAIQLVTIMLLALIGLTLVRNRQVATLWIALLIYTAVHMMFYVILRYRLPIMPAAIVLTAITLEYAYRRYWLRQ